MAEIKLRDGEICLVDEDDLEKVSQYKWYCMNGYAVGSKYIKGYGSKMVSMHRLINDTPAGFHTDHINWDRLDNRKKNLRTCTAAENAKNRRPKGVPVAHKLNFAPVSLPPGVHADLRDISANENRSMAQQIAHWIKQYKQQLLKEVG